MDDLNCHGSSSGLDTVWNSNLFWWEDSRGLVENFFSINLSSMEILTSLTTDYILKVGIATFLFGLIIMAVVGAVGGLVYGITAIIKLLQR